MNEINIKEGSFRLEGFFFCGEIQQTAQMISEEKLRWVHLDGTEKNKPYQTSSQI